MAKKNLTASVYSFEKLRTANYHYVDKTEYLWNLLQLDGAMYFLSRPRRFGKSLIISTLKAIFEGKKELFQGLAIYDKPYDWNKFPVIHIDNANCSAKSVEELRNYLHASIENIALSNNLVLRGETLSTDFEFLIDDLAKKTPIVILIDEYDKPILTNISNPAERNILNELKGFYATIKKCEGKIRFAFVTGVTKFCHVSLFSDLNNLTDISMDGKYAAMLGYTQAELEHNFAEWLADTEVALNLPREELLAELKNWYDGYRFEENAESVYNPVSLANFFNQGGKFDNYWFETGTPSFLMELIQTRDIDFNDIVSEAVPAVAFNAFELDDIDPVTLLYQTGYLTIRSTERKFGRTKYWLDFPNQEVSQSFNERILNAYTKRTRRDVANFCDHLTDAIVERNLPKFQKSLEVFFAGIPYDVHRKNEANFQNIFFAIFRLLGFNIFAESRTSDGRIDAVLETESDIYLFEFKLDRDDSALAQIKEKEYFKPFLLSKKTITLVGANFDTESGKLSNWQSEEFSAL